jgi:hypothetical protein
MADSFHMGGSERIVCMGDQRLVPQTPSARNRPGEAGAVLVIRGHGY